MKPNLLDHASLLSDATRCRILRALERQELTVSELCTVLQAPQSTVSRHLKVLRDHDWIDSRAQATRRFYRSRVEAASPTTRRLWLLLRDELESAHVASTDRQRLREVLKARSQASEQFFATAAGEWDGLRERLFGGIFDLQALPAFLDEELTVGDLGCGTGRLSELLAPFVRRIVAVDASGPMLEAAKRRLRPFPNVDVRRGDLENLPLEDETLDVAAIFLALHHVAEPRVVLQETARVLRPGGHVVVVDMQAHDREQYQAEMGHVWLGFSEEFLADLLCDSGIDGMGYRALPPALDAKGPGLFVARGRRPAGATHRASYLRRPTLESNTPLKGVSR